MTARRTRPPSVLTSLATLLMVSVLLRAGDQAMTATAQTIAPEPAQVQRADRILGMPLDDQTLPQLMQVFQEREAKLLENERLAAEQQEALRASAESIALQLEELAAAEERLAQTLATADVAAAEDLARLATVYENMKPRDTAALFAEMAPGFAAGFLGLMRPEAAAAIMTELEPNEAHLISVMLAGRNATAPTSE